MDTAIILGFLKESLFMIVVFSCFLVYAMVQGRQTITNVILGLYIALLFSIKFPYFDLLLGGIENAKSKSALMVIVFTAFTAGATFLFAHLMPKEYDESSFEGLGRKILLALGATILVMAFSYHALPVTDFITPGSPIQALFAPESRFFWWLLAPVVLLFLL